MHGALMTLRPNPKNSLPFFILSRKKVCVYVYAYVISLRSAKWLEVLRMTRIYLGCSHFKKQCMSWNHFFKAGQFLTGYAETDSFEEYTQKGMRSEAHCLFRKAGKSRSEKLNSKVERGRTKEQWDIDAGGGCREEANGLKSTNFQVQNKEVLRM